MKLEGNEGVRAHMYITLALVENLITFDSGFSSLVAFLGGQCNLVFCVETA